MAETGISKTRERVSTEPSGAKPGPDTNGPLFETLPTERAYVHARCGGTTVVSNETLRMVCNPYTTGTALYCAVCKTGEFPGQFKWTDTGESLGAYRRRMMLKSPQKGVPGKVRLGLWIVTPLVLAVVVQIATAGLKSHSGHDWLWGVLMGLGLAMGTLKVMDWISPPDYRGWR